MWIFWEIGVFLYALQGFVTGSLLHTPADFLYTVVKLTDMAAQLNNVRLAETVLALTEIKDFGYQLDEHAHCAYRQNFFP